jgi:hypothetical protein
VQEGEASAKKAERQTKMEIIALGLAVLTILAVTALLPIAIAQEVPAHVVMIEQVRGGRER